MRYLLSFLVFLLVTASVRAQSGGIVDMNEFFGVNVFKGEESPNDILPVSSWIRDYSRWEWMEPENNRYTFKNALDTINYDTYYRQLDSIGLKSLFVPQLTPAWISSGKDAPDPHHYAPSGSEDGLDPAQYREAASFYFQLAARYGSKKQPRRRLDTDDGLSGLNLMDVIEVYNEPDGTWGNKMTAEQYAALLNAVYDGNGGKMGKGFGVKAADKNMPVSIGGLSYNLQSLKKIVAAAGRAPFDIINVHFYTFHFAREKYRVAMAPEWSSLESDMREVVAWGKVHAPGRPVWLTEIGYDTKPHSTEYVTNQEAADYLIRSYLLALGAGVEKCFWFIFRDLDTWAKKPTVFSSSGLFENDTTAHVGATRLKPKLTYWYNATFKNLLRDYEYDSSAQPARKDSTVYRYDFVSKDKKKKMSVIWFCRSYQYEWLPLDPRPTSHAYTFTLPGKEWRLNKLVRPVAGSFEGREVEYDQKKDDIALTINGTPVFIETVQNEGGVWTAIGADIHVK